MPLSLDNRTQILIQVAVSITLFVVMWVAWRTQRTYPGFGRWTASKLPNALGWLLVSLRGAIPDWASVFVANMALILAPLLIFGGIRQFHGKSPRDWPNYGVAALLAAGFIYFTWVQPSVNARILIITLCTLVIIVRCVIDLFVNVEPNLRPSHWFTAAMFALFALILILRAVTSAWLPQLTDPFRWTGCRTLYSWL